MTNHTNYIQKLATDFIMKAGYLKMKKFDNALRDKVLDKTAYTIVMKIKNNEKLDNYSNTNIQHVKNALKSVYS
jgi:hypothetical protein